MEKIYYISVVKFEITIPIEGNDPVRLQNKVEQLVYASSKERARDAIMKDLRKQYPNVVIFECRIHDTIIGD